MKMMMRRTKNNIMSKKEQFYDYVCNSCDANYTSNEHETECFYCGEKTIVIQVKRPSIIRVRKKTARQELDEALDAMSSPDFDWDYAINKHK